MTRVEVMYQTLTMPCAVRKRTLHAHNDIHETGFLLALDEQDVRLYYCVFEFEGVIYHWYLIQFMRS